jgi:hypothetical protein
MNKKYLAALLPLVIMSQAAQATIKTEAGDINVDLRLRYEGVSTDAKDATGLTLRSVANFKTVAKNGFYGFAELENSLALIEDYTNPVNPDPDHAVILDPPTTELDQFYLGYAKDGLSVKVGRQVITLDGHRFVGHVGWRNDKQTFDAVSATYAATEKLKVSAAYISKRNRIFADDLDIDSSDVLLNASYKTPVGQLTGYGYLLEEDDSDTVIDTYGASLAGKKEAISYKVEFATQTIEAAGMEYDTSYLLAEIGTKVGLINVKAGYESLGSDDGMKGFATPLATLHKFNGWADQFAASTPAVGLDDLYATVAGKGLGGKWALTYHSYSANESTDTVDDLGSEINVVYNTKVSGFPLGIKYAMYTAGDDASGKVDTDKVWIWTGYKF